ncbi:MAG: hypothetical protein ACK41F_02490 [Fimbriimonadaceae bacterium]
MENLPSSPVDVLLWPVILILISAAIWYFALAKETKQAMGGGVFRLGAAPATRSSDEPKPVRWKWLALVPLIVLALWKSTWAYGLVTDTAFQLTYPGRKVTYALWATVAMPLIGAVILASYAAFVRSKRRRW